MDTCYDVKYNCKLLEAFEPLTDIIPIFKVSQFNLLDFLFFLFRFKEIQYAFSENPSLHRTNDFPPVLLCHWDILLS